MCRVSPFTLPYCLALCHSSFMCSLVLGSFVFCLVLWFVSQVPLPADSLLSPNHSSPRSLDKELEKKCPTSALCPSRREFLRLVCGWACYHCVDTRKGHWDLSLSCPRKPSGAWAVPTALEKEIQPCSTLDDETSLAAGTANTKTLPQMLWELHVLKFQAYCSLHTA